MRIARTYLSEALTSKLDRYEAVQALGYLSVLEHGWRQAAGKPDKTLYAQDMAALTEAIAEYPDLPVLKAQRGKLGLLAADSDKAIEVAKADIAEAIAENALLTARYGKLLTETKEMEGI